jgi:predicted HAD superfamily phosphohydrolase YqeG
MIGDNPATDIAGAERLGMASILVEPGSEVCLSDLIAPQDGRSLER